MDEKTQINIGLVAHLLVNVIFIILNVARNSDKGEIDPDDAIATKTELTIHCIISVLVLGFICFKASPDSDLSWLAILMGIHIIVSIVVFFVNVRSIHAPWLSWVFEGVSTGVLFIGAYLNYLGPETSAPAVATAKQFGKLLNFGKRRLK